MRRASVSFVLLAVASVCVGCEGGTSGVREMTSASESALSSKPFPTNRERRLGCPIVSTVADGFAPSSAPIQVDAKALEGVVDADVKAMVILIRRVGDKPIYRYLSNGTHDDIFQPWSSTKFLAAAGAAAKLRARSGGKVGLTAKADSVPLGDLVTVIASYREDVYTSNGLGRYFLNVAGRPEAGALIHTWLRRPADESYGGNYGAPAPNLPYTFAEANGEQVSVTPDHDEVGIPNALSTLTLAEALKRLAVWDDAATRLPGLEQADVEALLYGATSSVMFPGEVGGLGADRVFSVESALDIPTVEKESQGKWRVFGKYGAGNTQRVNVSYVCLPVLDAAGEPLRDRGAEFVIATQLTSGGVPAVDAAMSKIINQIVLPQAQTVGPDTNPPPERTETDAGGRAPEKAVSPEGDERAAPVDDGGCAASGATNRSVPLPIAIAIAIALASYTARRRRGRPS